MSENIENLRAVQLTPLRVLLAENLPNDTPPDPDIARSVATYPISTSLPVTPRILGIEQPPQGVQQ